jgi:hypothetical protein
MTHNKAKMRVNSVPYKRPANPLSLTPKAAPDNQAETDSQPPALPRPQTTQQHAPALSGIDARWRRFRHWRSPSSDRD